MFGRFLWDFLLPLSVGGGLFIAIDRWQHHGVTAYLTANRERVVAVTGTSLVVVLAIGVVYVLGTPPEMESRAPTLFHLAMTVFGAGVFATLHGVRHYRLAVMVGESAQVTPDEIPNGGSVVVTGVAESIASGEVVSTTAGDSALVVERGTLVGAEGVETAPDTTMAQALVSPTRRTVPFDLVGDYRTVRVDPADASLGFLHGELDDTDIERTVEPGDEVVVVGTAENGRLERAVAIAESGSANLWRFARNIPRVTAVGAVMGVLGYVGILVTAGVV